MSVDHNSASDPNTGPQNTQPVCAPLLAWYDRNARSLPWRIPPHSPQAADPYGVWLSEIMLQQTTVAAVGKYWARFRSLWPTVQDLARADDADVMREWAGLGYYARARNLLAAARKVAELGGFPDQEADLLELPGVGPYTAAAVAAFAFGRKAVVIDANIERVAARLFAIETPLPAGRPQITAALAPHVPEAGSLGRPNAPGDFAQALMDLGATLCTPKAPKCLLCPLADQCLAHKTGSAESFPKKAPKKARPVKQGLAWWIEHAGDVALVRRPSKGLLGGMLALPGTSWTIEPQAHYPIEGAWQHMPERVRHVFTHFELHLAVARLVVPHRLNHLQEQEILWTPREQLAAVGLPTLYAHAIKLVP